jgi:polysaccharide biosynthesis protein VpsM
MMKRIIAIMLFFCFAISSYTAHGEGSISGDIFGKDTGIYHPYLALTERYSSNYKKTEKNEEGGDLTTVITPGIWISLPSNRESRLELETSNTAPGGLSISRTKPESFRRYQSFLLIDSDIKTNLKHSDANIVNYKADGFFQYNLRGGLSFDFIDQLRNSHEPYGLGVSEDQDKYLSNLSQIILSYDITEKISVRTDYSNFLLQYEDKAVEDENQRAVEDANRSDNRFSGYLFYRIKSKTALFTEIEYMDISYRVSETDSNELRYFLGIGWDITEKSKGSFKVGLGNKKFKNPEFSDGDGSNMALELKLNHSFTPKTSIKLIGLRRTEETTIINTYYSLVNSISAEYLQTINEKVSMNGQLLFSNELYEGEFNYTGAELEEREDNNYGFSVGTKYLFREWLTGEASYIYNIRNSNIDGVGYAEHTIMFNITGAM